MAIRNDHVNVFLPPLYDCYQINPNAWTLKFTRG